MRIGFGYDVHAFAPNRELWLGGIRVPSEQGLLGHSDADVLVHAVMDALLGAAALRDIGYHFPDTDPAFYAISQYGRGRSGEKRVSDTAIFAGRDSAGSGRANHIDFIRQRNLIGKRDNVFLCAGDRFSVS